MKIITLLLCSLFFIPAFSQEHFSGISTSKRVGILNIGVNPSELSNLKKKFEIQLFSTSINIANNKVGFKDLTNGNDLEDLIFKGDKPVNLNVDAEFIGPGFAMRLLKWGFAVTTKGHVKANFVDIDTNLGSKLINSAMNSTDGVSTITNTSNQRINATAWGEVGFSVSRKIYETDRTSINGGVTFKLLFPGTYANVGLGNFNGTITTENTGDLILSDANANMNIAYSGSLADNFTNTNDYTKSIFGNLKGMATDVGIDYQLKDGNNSYKLKVGAAIKNMGSMTFSGDNNVSRNYKLEISGADKLNLNVFNDVEGIKDIEKVLLDSGYLKLENGEKDFKIKLPTVLNLYADVKVISKLNLTLFMQQKMNDNGSNNQITSQNIFSVTPRISLGIFEAYVPVSFNEISGTTGGFGFRLGGFFLGSNSIITALTSDSKQADLYTGFRFGFL
ncbi:DUF5723 family protein [Flavobacterium psychrotolerans]|uniref:DUF5723 domain-containing protein n=1 Tax=Flavobacterium psychrotolerans TaxID=2169410 RepID=A0A2U1JFH0_9FLAO|nr:DUF5723 family protein [Flavobacterium psychrotolerans]PWA03870.1 hypothetical protein DB895_13965 [Flavobacterium psychrotolerans]